MSSLPLTVRNIVAARDYMHRLSLAKDFTEVVRIQTEFMQSQFNAFGEQAKGLGEAYTKTAADTETSSPSNEGRSPLLTGYGCSRFTTCSDQRRAHEQARREG